jgi:hypothetical protein
MRFKKTIKGISKILDKIPNTVDELKCEYCDNIVESLCYSSFLPNTRIMTCKECYKIIDKSKHKLNSKVMDKYALITTGHYYNRKLAKNRF